MHLLHFGKWLMQFDSPPAIDSLYWDAYSNEQRIKFLFERIARLIEYLDEYNDMFEDFTETTNRQIDEIEKQIGNITQLKTDLQKIYNDLLAFNTRVNKLETDDATTKNDIENIKSSVASINGRLNGIESLVNSFSQRVSNLESADETIKTELRESYDNLSASINRVANSVTKANEKIDTIQTALSEQISTLAEKSNDHERRIKNNELTISNHTQRLYEIEENTIANTADMHRLELLDNRVHYFMHANSNAFIKTAGKLLAIHMSLPFAYSQGADKVLNVTSNQTLIRSDR